MKKIINERYQETYYEEVLENGLRVVLWQKPNYQKNLFMMATPLGAMDLIQVDEMGTNHVFPSGIAHFLEHKMFAMGEKDVMEEFSNMGANVNAFTSYNETAYYTSTSSDPIQPLHLLLDFVQELDINEATVEKEKGIIVQELHMYKEMSDQRLLMETYSSLYHNHPLKYDIGGDDDSVQSICVDQLHECYQLNYHPSRMMLIGVSGHDPYILMEEIRKNQAKKTFHKGHEVNSIDINEPAEVVRELYEFEMEVSEPKICVAYKVKGIEQPRERIQQEWATRLLLDANFSSLYPDYQKWLDEGIINDYCGYDADFGKDYGTILFYCETSKKDAFLDLCNACMQRIEQSKITEDVLVQLKRRYYAQSIRSMNSFDDIAITYIRCRFDGLDYFEFLDIVNELNMEDIRSASKHVYRTHKAVVEVKPRKK